VFLLLPGECIFYSGGLQVFCKRFLTLYIFRIKAPVGDIAGMLAWLTCVFNCSIALIVVDFFFAVA
jgi:hypothetical protein